MIAPARTAPFGDDINVRAIRTKPAKADWHRLYVNNKIISSSKLCARSVLCV